MQSLSNQGFTETQRKNAQERSFDTITIEEGQAGNVNTRVLRRSAILRKAAIEHFADANGSIACKACDFRAEEVYGPESKGLIEIHHRRPLFSNEGISRRASIQSAIEGVVPLCPTCHRIVSENPRESFGEKMKKRQNTSYAVMAQRIEAQDSLDDFPTPPWATRALIEHVLGGKKRVKSQVCLEPACGAGHMAKVLSEYFNKVRTADIHPHGYGDVHDFLGTPHETNSFDWVITNPPFRLGEDFTLLALKLARRGVAMLTRTVFIESVGRYDRLFSVNPPSHFAQFTERVPMVKGRLDRRASTATGYCWLVWDKESSGGTQLVWIPPCRKALERDSDYELPPKPVATAKSIGAKETVKPRVSARQQIDLFGT